MGMVISLAIERHRDGHGFEKSAIAANKSESTLALT
jgi:hypothetical protein